jgi:hypothetical protein
MKGDESLIGPLQLAGLGLGPRAVADTVECCKDNGLHAEYDVSRDVFSLYLLPGYFLSGSVARGTKDLSDVLIRAKRMMLRDALGL